MRERQKDLFPKSVLFCDDAKNWSMGKAYKKKREN